MARRNATYKKTANPYQGLYDEAADALADRVLEKQWTYLTGAGAALAYAAGLMLAFLYWFSAQPLWTLLMMPSWLLVLGGLLTYVGWAYHKSVVQRRNSLAVLVVAMIVWPIGMAIVQLIYGT